MRKWWTLIVVGLLAGVVACDPDDEQSAEDQCLEAYDCGWTCGEEWHDAYHSASTGLEELEVSQGVTECYQECKDPEIAEWGAWGAINPGDARDVESLCG